MAPTNTQTDNKAKRNTLQTKREQNSCGIKYYVPMPKSSTQFNSNELIKTKEKKENQLKKGTIKSILGFSRSYKVLCSGLISEVEYNIN